MSQYQIIYCNLLLLSLSLSSGITLFFLCHIFSV